MKSTPLRSVLLVVLCTLLVAVTHLLLKLAMARSGTSWGLAADPLLYAGIGVSLVGGVMLAYALKGGELSVLYPFISLGYVWVVVEGVWLFGERLHTGDIAGIAVIMVGVSVIGHNGLRKRHADRKSARKRRMRRSA